jgi:hypothetical protein
LARAILYAFANVLGEEVWSCPGLLSVALTEWLPSKRARGTGDIKVALGFSDTRYTIKALASIRPCELEQLRLLLAQSGPIRDW